MKAKSKTVKLEISNIAVGKNNDSDDLTPVSCTYKIRVSGRVVQSDVFHSTLSGRRLRKVRAKGGDNVNAVIKRSAARRLVESLLIDTAATTEHLRGAMMLQIFSPVKVTPLTVQIVDTLSKSLGFQYGIKVTE